MKTSAEFALEIVQLRKEHARWGPKKIAAIMARRHPEADTPAIVTIADFGPWRSPKPVDGDRRSRFMPITETGHGDRRNRACRSPKPVMAIA